MLPVQGGPDVGKRGRMMFLSQACATVGLADLEPLPPIRHPPPGGTVMHDYAALWPPDGIGELPRVEDYRFRSALDVVAWAQRDRTIGWKTWPEVWHVDPDGEFQCYHKGSSLDGLERWAEEPEDLCRVRYQGEAGPGCPSRWSIVDSRPAWLYHEPIVSERDAEAFVTIRNALAADGIELLDAVVFDDARHWWSMNELLTGTTTWPAAAPS